MLLQPLVQGVGGTPVAGCGAALSHHQSCHVDPGGFKPLSVEGRDCEEPGATYLPIFFSHRSAGALHVSHTERPGCSFNTPSTSCFCPLPTVLFPI